MRRDKPTCLSRARMKRGKSLRQAGASRPGCWMLNTNCRYADSESMAALVIASLASLRLAVTERSTAGDRDTEVFFFSVS